MIETKAEAELIAGRYRDVLGSAWKLKIWENLVGWHILWTQGAVRLYYSSNENRFWAMVGVPGSVGQMDMDLGPDGKHFGDPLVAVRHAAQRAQAAYREKWLPIIASVETILLESVTS